MVTLQWNTELIEADKAVKTINSVILYDENNYETFRINNIYGSSWDYISLKNGEWTSPAEIPTDSDRMRAELDFLQMENEALTMENEQLRADIDYCLMLLESETAEGER